MIADKIENAGLYTKLSERIAKGLAVLQDAVPIRKEDGRYEVEGDDIFYMVQRYTTKNRSDARFEAHRNYIDIQAILEGAETIGWAPTAELKVAEPYKPDVMFLETPGGFSEIYLPAGTFAIFYPSDAHMPCYHADKPSQVTKVVVKVRAIAHEPKGSS
jgi:YhcH/YjgK/YiaL family protein